MSRTPAEQKLDSLNKEIGELLRKKNKSKAERKRIDQIHGTLLPNVRKLIEEQRR
jgi:hypothetical protein